jgi:hypothetical protein
MLKEGGGKGGGQGLINYAMGYKIRGVFYKAQPHGQCVYIYADGFERGGVWELGTRTRWLTEEEEEERIAKASTAGAKSVNFLQGGHQFEMKADIPMSTQQREEARKKNMKDEEDAVMTKGNAALLGKPPSKKKGKQLALPSAGQLNRN